jgi:ATP-binding protein involved in chromosome partitioning
MNQENRSSIVVPSSPRPEGSPLSGVAHVIAVGSGKGGVGKSTTAVNLAFALKSLGARVGLLDADIYGPSVPKLLGLKEEPYQDSEKQKIIPPKINGVPVMSMGILGGQTPVIWRGPMASRAITQFLGEVDWGDLDYLIVDLPPGTGDIQLTLAQSAKLSGAVVVMTPQGLATEIAARGLKMFQQLRIPVIGIVENMSLYLCPHCNKEGELLGHGGGQSLSKDFGIPVLAEVPFDPTLVKEGDLGQVVCESRPDSKVAQVYRDMAKRMVAELSTLVSGGRSEKPIVTSIEPNSQLKSFKLIWSDGKNSLVSFKDLRFLCPCANCVDENTGHRKIEKSQIGDNVVPSRVSTVGNYAISIHFSDGHNTGIYSYDYLRRHLVK